MPKLTDIPMSELMKAMPKMTTHFAGDPIVFNLTIEQWESQKDLVPRPDWHMKFDDKGEIACGEGHIADAGAIPFNIKQGNGYQTLAGMFVHGLNDGTMQCAQMSMMMGKIGIPMDKIKQVQSFFKRVQIGIEPVKQALVGAGIQIEGE